MDSAILYKNRDEFTKVLKKAFKAAGINLNSSSIKGYLICSVGKR
jgi:type I restriction enzyme M protein